MSARVQSKAEAPHVSPPMAGGGGKAGRRAGVVPILLLAALAATLGCKKGAKTGAAAEAGNDAEKPVAVVGEDTLTVGQTANYMLAANLERTPQGLDNAIEDLVAVEIVKDAAATEKLTPEQEALRKEWEGQLRMHQFRDSVIHKSVTVPDSAVQAFYKDRVGDELKARHILIAVPPDATPEQKAAARAKAEEALKKARSGEDFAKLSREYSEPQTAGTGGDLGWFGKGDMVPAFEKAAFALKPGEVSDVVETRFGFHVVKVEDRRRKSLEELRPQIEKALAAPMQRKAEEAYIQKMMTESGLNFYEVNVDTLVKIFAQDSIGELSPERRNLPVAKWDKGQLTIGDVMDLFRTLPPENQKAVKSLDRDKMLNALAPLVRNRMLLARAETSGIQLDPERKRQLDERVEGLVVTEMLRKRVRDKAATSISDSAVQAAYAADSAKYGGKSLEQAQPEIRKALAEEQVALANTPDGQRQLVHEIADAASDTAKVTRLKENYALVLKMLGPAPAPEGRKAPAAAGGAAGPGAAESAAASAASTARTDSASAPPARADSAAVPGKPDSAAAGAR